MEKNTNFLERVHIICEINGLKNMQELAKALGYTSAEKLYRLERDPENKPSYQILLDFSNKFVDMDLNWLINGEGNYNKYRSRNDEVKTFNDETSIYPLKTDTSIANQAIPLYDVQASAGMVGLFLNKNKTKPVDFIQIPNLPKCDGAIYVTGDSMYPLLKSGDIIMYKQIQNLEDGIFWGEMYIISMDLDGEEFVSVKFVQKSKKGDDYILLVSQNQHHQERDVKLKKIRAMALVKASIRMNTMS